MNVKIEIEGWLKAFAWYGLILGILGCAAIGFVPYLRGIDIFFFFWGIAQIAVMIILIRNPILGIKLSRIFLWCSIIIGIFQLLTNYQADGQVVRLIVEGAFLVYFYDSDQVKGILSLENKKEE